MPTGEPQFIAPVLRSAGPASHAPLLSPGPRLEPCAVAVHGPADPRREQVESGLCSQGFRVTVCDPESRVTGEPEIVIALLGRAVSGHRRIFSRLQEDVPGTPVIAVVPADSRAAVRATIEAGALGVVFDNDLQRTLLITIAAARCGQVAVPAPGRRDVDRPVLSAREKQVMALVVMNLTNKEIAARLYISRSTVKSHMSSVLDKLGVRSRDEAVSRILDPASGLGVGILRLAPEPLAAEESGGTDDRSAPER